MLSGQYLHADEDSQLAIRVDVETVGVAEDCAVLSTEVRVTVLMQFVSFSPDVFTETRQLQHSTRFYTRRLRPHGQPLTFLYTV